MIASPRTCGAIGQMSPFVLSFAGVVKMYEARLKEVNPHQVHITYDITDLYGFIDELGDLSALV